MGEAIARALDRLWVRIALSVLILASLVPHPSDTLSDLVFLAIFGVELALRVIAFVKAPRAHEREAGATRRRFWAGLALVVDFIALMTFVPWAALTGIAEARWLRLLRLLRMLLLVGYWAPVLKDTWQVLTRHDRMRQVTLLGIIVGLLAFAGATVLSHIPVDGTDFDGDAHIDADDRHFWPRLWWAFRQVQDPGNMVTDPGEIAVVVVSLLLTVAGLFVVSFLIGLATDIVRELVALARNRPPNWKGHTVLVHATPGMPRLLAELMGYYERLFRRPLFVVADQAEEPPAELRSGELARVRWRQIDVRGQGLTRVSDVASARRVVVLAKPDAPFPDAHAAATVLDVREANARAWVVVEVLEPNNVAAARVAGGARTVIVSTEKLLGIWALAAIRRPEQIALAWEILATRGGSEIYTCFFDADGLDGPGVPWRPAAGAFAGLVDAALASAPGGRHERKRRHAAAVIPIGVVYGDEAAQGGAHEDGEAVIAPARIEARPVRALIAIGDDFKRVEALAHALHGGVRVPGTEAPQVVGAPRLAEVAPIVRPRRVLVCGFRPGTVVVCAGLLAEGSQTAITLVMRHEESVRQAAQAFREHGLGEARGVCFAGRFEAVGVAREGEPPSGFRWVPREGEGGGEVRLVRADWSSERTLSGLEAGVAHVGSYDLVLMMGAHLPEYDGRNAIACLKIADLARVARERFTAGSRVVVGVADRELGRRLEESFARATRSGGPALTVLPTEDLRALFVFQSIVVPGWEAIFLELLGPGGMGLMRVPLAEPAAEHAWRFAELAASLAERGVLFALELTDGRHLVAPSPRAGPWREAEIAAVWMVAREP